MERTWGRGQRRMLRNKKEKDHHKDWRPTSNKSRFSRQISTAEVKIKGRVRQTDGGIVSFLLSHQLILMDKLYFELFSWVNFSGTVYPVSIWHVNPRGGCKRGGESYWRVKGSNARQSSCHAFFSSVFNKNPLSSEIHCTSNHLSSPPLPSLFLSIA